MSKIISFDLTEHFIEKLAEYIQREYVQPGKNLSRLAVVFGGRRPALFLKRELAKNLRQTYFPPVVFAMDEFIEYLVSQEHSFSKIPDLEACYWIYKLARETTPDIIKGRNTFSKFLPWAREILIFIEQLDLEDVRPAALLNIQMNAAIGYEVPQNINHLLQNIVKLRETYQQQLESQRTYTRGLMYLKAADGVDQVNLKDFDEILFCNFFYLHQTEEKIIYALYKKGKAKLIFQGDDAKWPVLKKLSSTFQFEIEPVEINPPSYQLNFHAGFDTHSQVGIVREILKTFKSLDNTVIVLPESNHVIPLLSQVSSLTDNFNVSLGYPLKRGPLYSLFRDMFKAQKEKREEGYYAKDYLRVLRHPFVKNLRIHREPSVARVLAHKVEEILLGQESTSLGGSLFIGLDEIENERKFYEMTKEILARMDIQVNFEELKEVVRRLHELLFKSWEDLKNLEQFAVILESFLEQMVESSPLKFYPLNLQMVQRMLSLSREIKTATFRKEPFDRQEIFKIFLDRIENEMIAFSGTPLRGLQILGLLETRSLNFENVIIMDVNETVLPNLRIFEPLIPREVTLGLNLNRLEKEEEIQRYQFLRLLAGAKNVHLVYEESRDKERSRFIEELIWEREKASGTLNVVNVPRGSFQVSVLPKQMEFKKTDEIVRYLRNFSYSATSLNTYMRCPLRFYYQYVLGLNIKEDLLEEPESMDVGNFVHQLLEQTYKKFIGKKPQIDEKFKSYFQKIFDELFEETMAKRMKADAFLLKKVLEFRLGRFLESEAHRDVKEIICLEKKFEGTIELSTGAFQFTYRVDRIDRLSDGRILIIDYKTGNAEMPSETVDQSESPWTRERVLRTVKSFQIPLYYYFLSKEYQDTTLEAAFYNLRTAELKYLPKKKERTDPAQLIDFSLKALDFTIGEILNPQFPFKADDRDPKYCSTCPFYDMCR